MLQENLKILRTQKCMSQEELADRLNVVRQTVSKWEKGLSVPDSEMLIRIAEVFEVSVGELLGETIVPETEKSELQQLSEKLENLNAMMAERNARSKTLMKIAAICMIVAASVFAVVEIVPLIALTVLLAKPVDAGSVGIIGGADGPTAVFVTGQENLDIDSIKSLLDGVDPTALLPDLSGLFGSLETVCRWAVMIGPVLLLAAGLAYLFLSPKEANYYFGYRTYFGMGSVHAWRFTQRLAGAILGGLGLILTVIMLIVSSGFGKLEVMDMVWRAVSCLTWEAVLALLANVTVAAAAAATFDRNGEFRKKKKK